MNEIFAIDPRAPQDLKDIKAMFNQFGFENGRFIANFPNDWLRLFCEHTQNLKDIEKQRFMRLVEIHKDTLLDIALDYRRSKTWVENANLAKDTSRSIYRILATDPNPLGIETLQKFLWVEDEENRSRGAHINMTTDAYQKAVRPLLQRSTEVHLADPFFHLRKPEDGKIHKGRETVLRQFFIEAENSNRCEIFKIPDNGLPLGLDNICSNEFTISSIIFVVCELISFPNISCNLSFTSLFLSDNISFNLFILLLSLIFEYKNKLCKKDHIIFLISSD